VASSVVENVLGSSLRDEGAKEDKKRKGRTKLLLTVELPGKTKRKPTWQEGERGGEEGGTPHLFAIGGRGFETPRKEKRKKSLLRHARTKFATG